MTIRNALAVGPCARDLVPPIGALKEGGRSICVSPPNVHELFVSAGPELSLLGAGRAGHLIARRGRSPANADAAVGVRSSKIARAAALPPATIGQLRIRMDPVTVSTRQPT